MNRYLPYSVKYNNIIGPLGTTNVVPPEYVSVLYIIGIIKPQGLTYDAEPHAYYDTSTQDWIVVK